MKAGFVAFAVAAGVLLQPAVASAQAGGRGFLERLSGPGPFDGWEYEFTVYCVREGGERQTLHRCWTARTPSRHSFTVTFSHLESDEDDVFGEVRLYSFRPAFMVRLDRTVDIGFGAGLNWFTGDRFDRLFRLSFQPVRVVWTPLAAFSDDRWSRILRIPVHTTIFQGSFDGEDFGAPRDVFEERFEVLWGAAIQVDLGVFFER